MTFEGKEKTKASFWELLEKKKKKMNVFSSFFFFSFFVVCRSAEKQCVSTDSPSFIIYILNEKQYNLQMLGWQI